MNSLLSRYADWLHLRWPAGTVEKLPDVREDGTCNVPGVRITGDLTGIPLLKFAADSGARAVRAISTEPDFQRRSRTEDVHDLAIVGGGVAGLAAALEASALGLRFAWFEASQPFSTVANFPRAKPIYLYPAAFTPAGQLHLTATVKEDLLSELDQQRAAADVTPDPRRVERLSRSGSLFTLHHDGTPTRAHRVIIAIGRSGNFRKLGCPGEELDKVSNRLHDPREFRGRRVLVVGGGDSALEAAIALGTCGADVTLSYRKPDFARPKPENIAKLEALRANPDAPVTVEHPSSERVTTAVTPALRGNAPGGRVRLELGSQVLAIEPDTARLRLADGREESLPNDAVFPMIGREAPLDFFRRSGIAIRGEWRPSTYAAFTLFFAFCVVLYLWKSGGSGVNTWFKTHGWFPFHFTPLPAGHIASSFTEIFRVNLATPSFYYSLAYTVLVAVFGIRRIRRRRTPYITAQTLTLFVVQFIPLFLLPSFVLPQLGAWGVFDEGTGRAVADALFPAMEGGHGREYWRCVGFVLAWPLFVWNIFTEQPLWAWLGISLVQTFVLIPLLVRRWGKGAYCGWICSCGALAETLGDDHRHKMPHGPVWNRLNFVGQVILAVALLLLALRLISWTPWGGWAGGIFSGLLSGWSFLGVQFNYYHVVDLLLAGIVGVGLYFWFSGRVWCRFACPLAALMHIYARFSRFRIFSEKSKCISCNVCTSVCHQGIDIMNFANKGVPLEDPQCVRCSACVQSCPTGVLSFGHLTPAGVAVPDRLPASSVRQSESPHA